MRICTQCGHRLSSDEFLCPACEMWDSKAYTEPRGRRGTHQMATVFVGPLQQAILIRQVCEGAGIPVTIDAERGASRRGTMVRVQVPAERAVDVAGLLERTAEEDGSPEDHPAGMRGRRTHLRARLSLRRRAYQALAWSIVALLFPPAGLIAGRLALLVLSENHGLPVVTEESRIATASLVISATSLVVCGVLLWLVLRGI